MSDLCYFVAKHVVVARRCSGRRWRLAMYTESPKTRDVGTKNVLNLLI